jgi:carboxylesterase
MRYLGGYLAQRGFRAVGLRLPGHGIDPLALERSKAQDWIGEARARLLELPADKPAFLVGLSMGALIAAIVAAEQPERVAGLALCAPALRLRRPASAFLGVGLGLIGGRRFIPKKPPALVDPKMRAQMPTIGRLPLAAAAQFARVQVLARKALPAVTAPAMVVYSDSDGTVPPSAAREVSRLLGTRPARMLRLERSSHVVTLDLERERVALEIERFFRSLL